MNSEPKDIKLEEEALRPTNISEFISGLPGWTIHSEETIYIQASCSFEQLVESYRYRSAGHPVAIKIEEQNNQEEETELHIVEEIQENPEIAETEHLAELQRAVRVGTRRATREAKRQSNRFFPKRAKPSPRAQVETDLALAEVATSAASRVWVPTDNFASIPDPETAQETDPSVPGLVLVKKEGVIQPKEEEWDC